MSPRDPLDFYRTPSEALRPILPVLRALGALRRGNVIVDAGCGDGAILAEIDAATAGSVELIGIELDAARAKAAQHALGIVARVDTADFLTWVTPWAAPDLVIANPPFNACEVFVEQALRLVGDTGTVAMFLRLAFLESQKRAALLETAMPDCYVLPWRPRFSGAEGTDKHAYMWAVWPPGKRRSWGEIRRLRAPDDGRLRPRGRRFLGAAGP